MRALPAIFLSALSLIALNTSAQEDTDDGGDTTPSGGEMYLGGFLGSAIPTGAGTSNLNSQLGFGAHAGYCPQYHLGVGAYFLSSSGRIEDTVDDFSVSFYGLEGTYFLEEEGGFHAGLRAGLTHVSNQVLGNTVKINPVSTGPFFGYDYELKRAPISLGAEANMMFVLESKDDVGGTVVKSDPFQVINLLFSVKLWI